MYAIRSYYVPDKPASERRQTRNPRAPVLVHDLLDVFAGMFRFKRDGADLHPAILTGDRKLGIIAQKRVSAPFRNNFV